MISTGEPNGSFYASTGYGTTLDPGHDLSIVNISQSVEN